MSFRVVSLNLCYNLPYRVVFPCSISQSPMQSCRSLQSLSISSTISHAELSFLAVSLKLCYNLPCRVVVPCSLSQSLLQSPMQSCHSLQYLSISAIISHAELSFLAVSLNLCYNPPCRVVVPCSLSQCLL